MRNFARITLMIALSGGLLASSLSCGLIGSALPAKSTTQYALAKQDASVSSYFTLDFGEYGGERIAQISRTDFLLEFDQVNGTARFASYYQVVDPIELPGGISTGKITVVLQNSLGGTLNTNTGEFLTDDVYAIYFDGELSAFGIESPFVLPSTSEGTLSFDADTQDSGQVKMTWAGSGTLGALPFWYDCNVTGVFESTHFDEPVDDGLLGPQ
jgi:hypothetical protein